MVAEDEALDADTTAATAEAVVVAAAESPLRGLIYKGLDRLSTESTETVLPRPDEHRPLRESHEMRLTSQTTSMNLVTDAEVLAGRDCGSLR